jgi:hypothetical protein
MSEENLPGLPCPNPHFVRGGLGEEFPPVGSHWGYWAEAVSQLGHRLNYWKWVEIPKQYTCKNLLTVTLIYTSVRHKRVWSNRIKALVSSSKSERSQMTRKAAVLLFLWLVSLAPSGFATSSHSSGRGHSSHSHSSDRGHSSKSHGAKKSKATKSAGAGSVAHPSYRANFVAPGYSADKSVRLDKHGKIKRSGAAKHAFEREQPCPATGKSSGPCRGHIVDHKTPLECGGADSPSNMQWQTVADAKEKDKTERSCRL